MPTIQQQLQHKVIATKSNYDNCIADSCWQHAGWRVNKLLVDEAKAITTTTVTLITTTITTKKKAMKKCKRKETRSEDNNNDNNNNTITNKNKTATTMNERKST